MVVRIVQILIGLGLAGGGGYLAFLNRAQLNALWPIAPQTAPLMLIAGLGLIFLGLIFLLTGAMPSPPKKKDIAEATAKKEAHLKQADALYAGRAKGDDPKAAADRDWRSGAIPPQPAPAPKPAPPPPPPQQPPRQAAPPPPPPHTQAKPAPQPELVTPSPAKPAQVKPQASATPPPAPSPAFPSAATLSPLPRAGEPPPQAPPPKAAAPAPAPSKPAPAPAPAPAGGAPSFDRIRKAITSGDLAGAEKFMAEEREKLAQQGAAASKLAGAELIALGGDHAAAAGDANRAQWLWRLAMKKFEDAGGVSTPVAKALAEKLK